MQLSPAEYVIHVFGGISATARAIGRSKMAVSYWKTQSKGRVPGPSQALVLAAARKKKLDITPEDLIRGRRIDARKK